MHDEKEYKLGTCSQVSIASSYIREIHSSNCCGFLPDAVWLSTSCVNYMTCLVEMPHLFLWKCHILSCGNNIFHGKIWHFTHEILRVATCVHACRNEVVIEWYRITKWFYRCLFNYVIMFIILLWCIRKKHLKSCRSLIIMFMCVCKWLCGIMKSHDQSFDTYLFVRLSPFYMGLEEKGIVMKDKRKDHDTVDKPLFHE